MKYNGKLYHVSDNPNLDKTIMKPRISKHPMEGEENKTKRISFAQTIDGCLAGVLPLHPNKKLNDRRYHIPSNGFTFYVYEPIGDFDFISNEEILKKKLVPDAELSKEVWIITPVNVKKIGMIHVEPFNLKTAEKIYCNFYYKDKVLKGYGVKFKWKWIDSNTSKIPISKSNKRKLLLTSTGFDNKNFATLTKRILEEVKPIKDCKVLFIPIADKKKESIDACMKEILDLGILKKNIETTYGDLSKINNSNPDMIYVTGGDENYLIEEINRLEGFRRFLLDLINKGVLYIGVSAGSVICGTYVKNNLAIIDNNLDCHCTKNIAKDGVIINSKAINLTDNQALLILGNKKEVIENCNTDDEYKISLKLLDTLTEQERKWTMPNKYVNSSTLIFKHIEYDGNKPIAFIDLYNFIKGRAFILYMVHKDYRKQGIGKKLLDLAKKFAEDNNYEKLDYYVRKGNVVSYKVAERYGFKLRTQDKDDWKFQMEL